MATLKDPIDDQQHNGDHVLSVSQHPSHATISWRQPMWKVKFNFFYVFGGGQTGGIITTTCIGHVTEIYELVCVLMLLTKESHACG